MNTDKLLSQLVDRLSQAYGHDLRSVVLYGSAAAGDFHQKHSDLNILCVLRDVGVESLQKAEQTAHWWRSFGNPAPLLWAENELACATDAFPVEFLDLREQHRVLHGEDLVAGLTIDPAFHRVQVEHELRTKLLALRQRYLGIYRDQKMVLKLMVDALPSFVHIVSARADSGRPGGADGEPLPRGCSDPEARGLGSRRAQFRFRSGFLPGRAGGAGRQAKRSGRPRPARPSRDTTRAPPAFANTWMRC